MDEREIEWYRRFGAPPSQFSPRTRMIQVGAFRTMFEIFWNKHSKTGEPTLSYIHPDIPVPIVLDEEWHALEIGDMPEYQMSVDVNKSFFDQFEQLVRKIPMGARREWRNIKNTVGVGMWDVEDSYMVFSTVGAKRCMYTYYCLEGSEDITQSIFVLTSQNCFGCVQISRCHSCRAAFESSDCINCSFIYDCRNCEFVFGGANLRYKKFVWFNEQLTEEEWCKRFAQVNLGCRSQFNQHQTSFRQLVEQSASPENFNTNAQESTGEYLTDCVRCRDCYYLQRGTDCWFAQSSRDSEGCAFVSAAYPAHQSWMSSMLNECHNTKYSHTSSRSTGLEYCVNCHDCEDCFGCNGLRKKKFHIFNKLYSEDAYWQTVDALKCAMLDRGEYGQFLPLSLSPTGLQFSQVDAFYDLLEKDVVRFGSPLYDADRGIAFAPQKTLTAPLADLTQVPDCISEVQSDWAQKPFLDPDVHRRWSVPPQELAYLKRSGLPFPQSHYSTRLRDLYLTMNRPEAEQKHCASCQKLISVGRNKTFPNRRVYCSSCYLKYLNVQH